MTQANYLEVGKILNTHGVRGELKVQPWLDTPQLFQALPQLFVNGKPYTVQSVRMQGPNVLVMLEGITSIDDALPLKGRVASAKREDIPLEEGRHFVADLIGLQAAEAAGQECGDRRTVRQGHGDLRVSRPRRLRGGRRKDLPHP